MSRPEQTEHMTKLCSPFIRPSKNSWRAKQHCLIVQGNFNSSDDPGKFVSQNRPEIHHSKQRRASALMLRGQRTVKGILMSQLLATPHHHCLSVFLNFLLRCFLPRVHRLLKEERGDGYRDINGTQVLLTVA